MKSFSLKFLDIMIGLVLGLGFQWWPNLAAPWQYLAFIFVYIDIVDYWIDYGPSLKKFPPKREIDIMLDVAIMFSLFFYIYATQLTPVYFFGAFAVFRILDYFWLFSSKREYHPTRTDRVFVETWMTFDLLECALSLVLLYLAVIQMFAALPLLLVFIAGRILMRVLASWRYKRVHFV